MNIPQRNNIGLWLAGVVVLACLIRIPNGSEMRAMTRLTTETLLIMGLAAVLFRYVNPWLGLFVAIVAITSLFPAFDRFAYLRRNAVLIGAAWYAIVYFTGNKEYLFNALCVVALINAFAALLQACGIDPYRLFSFGTMNGDSAGRIVGLMFNEGELSCLLGMTFPLFLRKRWFWYVPLVLLALFLAKSTVGIVAVAAILIIGMAYYRLYWFMLPVALLGACYVIFWDTNILKSGAVRMDFLKTAGRIFLDHPLGIGAGHWHLATNQLHAHNDIAQMTVETGLLGLFAMIGYVISMFRKIDIFGAMCLVSILIISLCSFSWFIPTTAIMAVTILAIVNQGQGECHVR